MLILIGNLEGNQVVESYRSNQRNIGCIEDKFPALRTDLDLCNWQDITNYLTQFQSQ